MLRPRMTEPRSTPSPPGARPSSARGMGHDRSRKVRGAGTGLGAVGRAGGPHSLTVVIHQPEAVVDPVVGLFSPRFLRRQDGEDAQCSRGSSGLPSLPPSLSSIPPPSPLHRLSIRLPPGRGSLKPPLLPSPPPPRPGPVSPRASHSVLFHEIDEGRALHLHGLPLPVIHGQHEVEEVGFPEVGGGLLLKMRACQAHAAARRKGAGQPPEAPSWEKDPSPSNQVGGCWSGRRDQMGWAPSTLARDLSSRLGSPD